MNFTESMRDTISDHNEMDKMNHSVQIKCDGVKFALIYPKRYVNGSNFADNMIASFRSIYNGKYNSNPEFEDVEHEKTVPYFEMQPNIKNIRISDKEFDEHNIGCQILGVAIEVVIDRTLVGKKQLIEEIINAYREHLAEFLSHNPDATIDD